MKTFRYDLQEHVPALAWLMEVCRATEEVVVKHGTAVECHEDFFAAGVWAGEFGKGEIDTTPYACCSGGRLRKMGGVIPYPSAHRRTCRRRSIPTARATPCSSATPSSGCWPRRDRH